MLLTPHVFVGVAIATTVPNIAISVPLSFMMHFIGDLVPHWDFYSNTTKEQRITGWRPVAVMADLIIGVGVGLTSTYYSLWYLNDPTLALSVFLCGIASVLPDALETPHIFLKNEPRVLKILSSLQSTLQFQAPLPWGIYSQLAVIVFASYIITTFLRSY